MTYKQIEASREARLWIGQVIVPVVTCVATVMAIPEVRQTIADKAKDLRDFIGRSVKNRKGSY